MSKTAEIIMYILVITIMALVLFSLLPDFLLRR